ncbi:MAG: pseudouridine synthase [Candidatus Omnitrophica bacterium]|nr:pseudouridine synthase [Candidatus Omnitrophota bacterium]
MLKRLQVILAHAGIASRRNAAVIIAAGRVRVNGVPVTEKGIQCDRDKDTIEVDGRRLRDEIKVYYVINKPRGFVTTVSDERGRKTVLDLIPRTRFRIYPVGRLDRDTEGVLILTNDGELAHKLSHPRFGVEKIYVAEVKGIASHEAITRLERGVFMDGSRTRRCKITVMERRKDKMYVKVILREGKKRQIRRMMEMIGCHVIRLRRTSDAGITSEGLSAGKFRQLDKNEIRHLRELCLVEEGAHV